MRAIFEQHAFGELERLVTEKLLHVVKGVAKRELDDENWLHLVARLSNQSCEQIRVRILEFLDADVFTLSPENCVSFVEPLVESWDVNLATFGMDILLNRRVAPGQRKKFEFVETEPDQASTDGSGLRESFSVTLPERGCYRNGNRVPEETSVHPKAAQFPLLLQGVAKPERPPALS